MGSPPAARKLGRPHRPTVPAPPLGQEPGASPRLGQGGVTPPWPCPRGPVRRAGSSGKVLNKCDLGQTCHPGSHSLDSEMRGGWGCWSLMDQGPARPHSPALGPPRGSAGPRAGTHRYSLCNEAAPAVYGAWREAPLETPAEGPSPPTLAGRALSSPSTRGPTRTRGGGAGAAESWCPPPGTQASVQCPSWGSAGSGCGAVPAGRPWRRPLGSDTPNRDPWSPET